MNTTKSTGYKAGALAQLVSLHMDYYGRNWNFGLAFETGVACGLTDFLTEFNAEKDLFSCRWSNNGDLLASITIMQDITEPTIAHLRWLIVAKQATGLGLGRELLKEALRFCRPHGYQRVRLHTFAGLQAARRLYESAGFELTAELGDDKWKQGVTEQHFECVLD